MTRNRITALAFASAAIAFPAAAAPVIGGILGDHAVIQRGQPIVVEGTATPGETVAVALNGVARSSKTDREGQFRVTLPPMIAGGPYEIIVSAPSGGKMLRDILIGDVFLCSGQSNMEASVERMQESNEARYGPGDDQLRLVTIPHRVELKPLGTLADRPIWAPAGPQTSLPFSAACFYMTKALRKSAKVPIGAIHSSWGGSQIGAWMGDDAQRAAGRSSEADLLKLYDKDPAAANRMVAARWETWWRQKSGDAAGHEPWHDGAALAWKPVPKVAYYNAWGDPKLDQFLGMLWYRNQMTLTPAQARQTATILLGPVDDADQTWINGKAIGGSSNGEPRVYHVPAGTFVAGSNVVTVSVANAYATGGMPGPASAMKLIFADGSEVPLGDGWRYAIVDRKLGTTPRAPWDDITGAGTLYNGMIAPLGHSALAGVAWYQGESDTDIPGYADRLKAMMSEWRGQFGQPALPFAIASLSAYGKPATAPQESGWGYIRDAQRRVAEQDGHAAVAITVDLGDPKDIHPGEKHEVGQRLARAMQSLVYGDAISASGPRVTTAERSPDGTITLHFTDVAGALHTRSATMATGFELCAAAPGTCRYVTARAAGRDIVLTGETKPATRVRYAYADYPVVNVVDDTDLPIGPFEIAIP
jgi:sialate O-acetylesterase